MARSTKLYELSGRIIDYLIEVRKVPQARVAEALEVDKSFISRVRSRERELSNAHMEQLAEALGIDLGVLLIEASRPKKPVSAEKQQLLDLCEKLMKQADAAIAAMRSKT